MKLSGWEGEVLISELQRRECFYSELVYSRALKLQTELTQEKEELKWWKWKNPLIICLL